MSDNAGSSVISGNASDLVSPSIALLFVAAVAASLFFNGVHVEYFAVAMILLLMWVVVLCWQGTAGNRSLPGGLLLLVLGLYQAWLLITLLWNPVPYLGINYFCLLATPLLVVMAWNLVPSPERLWCYIWPLLLLTGVGLMGYALYQYYWLAEAPHGTFINRNSLAAMLNMLMLLAVSRVLLLARERKLLLASLLVGVAVAALLVGLAGSRGAFLGLTCGILVLIGWAVYQREARARIWLSIAAIAVGVVISNLSFVNVQDHTLTERMGALSDPYSAGNDRFLIWGQSLKMAEEKPLTGYGLGTYWQYWPQWRDPADSTAGFWAHSDLLHLGIEAGLPAVLLLLSVHFALLLLLWRVLQSTVISLDCKSELVALFAGLLAVAVHAQFTFNYYTLPILLVLSLLMARIARIERDVSGAAGWVGYRRLRLFIPLLGLLAVLYFAAIGLSAIIFEQAVDKMRQGELQLADQKFILAQQFWGATDMFPYTHALLKEQQLSNIPADDIEQRKTLYLEAQQLLDLAIENNPLRPISYFIQGRLLVTAAELAGEDWLERAETAFKQSLLRDPRYLEARLTLARILEVTGRQADADILLEEGMPNFYSGDDPNLLTYYKMLASARSRAGDLVGASEVVERYNQIVSGLIEKQRIKQESKRSD